MIKKKKKIFVFISIYFFCSIFVNQISFSKNLKKSHFIANIYKQINTESYALLRGLSWCENYVKKDRNFNFIFSNYILMLYELRKNRNEKVKNKAIQLLENALKKASEHLDDIFDADIAGKWDFISIIPILKDFPIKFQVYKKFYHTHFPSTFYDKKYNKNIFHKAISKLNYGLINDYLIDSVFVNILRSQTDFNLPPNHFHNYIQKINSLPFAYRFPHEGYHHQNYLITHIILTLSNYDEKAINLNHSLVKKVIEYIKINFDDIRHKTDDIDLIAEILQCWRICKLSKSHQYKEAIHFLFKQQIYDGSWLELEYIDLKEDDPYDIFHSTWAVLTGLNNF